ncbi:MAG: hypothetical protein GEV28_16355 [Actinophytocola sp.]|uniref:hypothetical protein n=1 Tax=Actinophytocola sp. TaxID=1872138 RepID=UPI0013215730|nr:hypothetical protein [Actinophytocola sp.]MPZ81872.1 hypothetical protein [Actinophytocola sp.]
MAHDDEFMRTSDAFSWYQESDPATRATIVAVVWLDRAPDLERLVERVGAASKLVPRLRQRVVEPPARIAVGRGCCWPNLSWATAAFTHRPGGFTRPRCVCPFSAQLVGKTGQPRRRRSIRRSWHGCVCASYREPVLILCVGSAWAAPTSAVTARVCPEAGPNDRQWRRRLPSDVEAQIRRLHQARGK